MVGELHRNRIIMKPGPMQFNRGYRWPNVGVMSCMLHFAQPAGRIGLTLAQCKNGSFSRWVNVGPILRASLVNKRDNLLLEALK